MWWVVVHDDAGEGARGTSSQALPGRAGRGRKRPAAYARGERWGAAGEEGNERRTNEGKCRGRGPRGGRGAGGPSRMQSAKPASLALASATTRARAPSNRWVPEKAVVVGAQRARPLARAPKRKKNGAAEEGAASSSHAARAYPRHHHHHHQAQRRLPVLSLPAPRPIGLIRARPRRHRASHTRAHASRRRQHSAQSPPRTLGERAPTVPCPAPRGPGEKAAPQALLHAPRRASPLLFSLRFGPRQPAGAGAALPRAPARGAGEKAPWEDEPLHQLGEGHIVCGSDRIDRIRRDRGGGRAAGGKGGTCGARGVSALHFLAASGVMRRGLGRAGGGRGPGACLGCGTGRRANRRAWTKGQAPPCASGDARSPRAPATSPVPQLLAAKKTQMAKRPHMWCVLRRGMTPFSVSAKRARLPGQRGGLERAGRCGEGGACGVFPSSKLRAPLNLRQVLCFSVRPHYQCSGLCVTSPASHRTPLSPTAHTGPRACAPAPP